MEFKALKPIDIKFNSLNKKKVIKRHRSKQKVVRQNELPEQITKISD